MRKKPFNHRHIQMALLPLDRQPIFVLEVKLMAFGDTQQVKLSGVALDSTGKKHIGFAGSLDELKQKDLSKEVEELLRHFFLGNKPLK